MRVHPFNGLPVSAVPPPRARGPRGLQWAVRRRPTRKAAPTKGRCPLARNQSTLQAPAGSNRLAHEVSPYLLQHAGNPVDWYPWGADAFDKAAREDKPIFLSIGYSSCHWCHVMEAESFDRHDVADILNEHYVAVKVDREERPDVDAVYMLATQMITGRGGWPNSLWLTPKKHCWYAGTYFPREDAGDQPGFKTVLQLLADVWRNRRDQADAQARKIDEAMKQHVAAAPPPASGPLSYDLLDQATQALHATFDHRHGGFGPAPKFPPHGPLLLLAREYARTGRHQLLDMLDATLDAMARGGIRDHLAGGFHRYATDSPWFLPHFEKMLYDNAQLVRAYVEGYRLTGRETFRDVALETCRWILTELTDQAGGFYSALDADSEGHEGLFYLWPYDELVSVLGRRAAGEFAAAYGACPEGNFAYETAAASPETNILHLPRPLDETARLLGTELPALAARLAAAREKLLAARSRRVRPGCDDKILAGWNALTISSLAFAGKALGEPSLIAAAERAAKFILHSMFHDGRLLRSWRAGHTRPGACLDDYAFLAAAFLDLHAATGADHWLTHAAALTDTMTALFADPSAGGFFFTPADRTDLPYRLKDPFDQATPSGNAVAVSVLIRLSLALSDPARLAFAHRALQTFQGLLERAPAATSALLLSASDYLAATNPP